jgi:hypothetical protein
MGNPSGGDSASEFSAHGAQIFMQRVSDSFAEAFN